MAPALAFLTALALASPTDDLLPTDAAPPPAAELLPITDERETSPALMPLAREVTGQRPADPRELPLVLGGLAAPSAWLALWRGDAWVCWDLAAFQCWQRLDLAAQLDLTALRAEFVDASTLVLGDRSDATWLIVRGDPLPRLVAWTATPRHSPQSHACSPSGPLPIADDDGLHFIDRPCPEARERRDTCVHPGHRLRLRGPQPLRLRLALELQARSAWRLHADRSATTGVQLLAFIAIGLDPAAWLLQRRERADLQAQGHPGLRALPLPRSRGPLRDPERLALRAAICGGAS